MTSDVNRNGNEFVEFFFFLNTAKFRFLWICQILRWRNRSTPRLSAFRKIEKILTKTLESHKNIVRILIKKHWQIDWHQFFVAMIRKGSEIFLIKIKIVFSFTQKFFLLLNWGVGTRLERTNAQLLGDLPMKQW